MFVYRCSFTQARMRHVLIWLLAWLLPLQATAAGDLSVVRAAQDGPMSNPDGDEGPSAAASLASVLAMIPKCLPWEPSLPVSTLAAHAAWALLTGFDEPPDRPPMRG